MKTLTYEKLDDRLMLSGDGRPTTGLGFLQGQREFMKPPPEDDFLYADRNHDWIVDGQDFQLWGEQFGLSDGSTFVSNHQFPDPMPPAMAMAFAGLDPRPETRLVDDSAVVQMIGQVASEGGRNVVKYTQQDPIILTFSEVATPMHGVAKFTPGTRGVTATIELYDDGSTMIDVSHYQRKFRLDPDLGLIDLSSHVSWAKDTTVDVGHRKENWVTEDLTLTEYSLDLVEPGRIAYYKTFHDVGWFIGKEGRDIRAGVDYSSEKYWTGPRGATTETDSSTTVIPFGGVSILHTRSTADEYTQQVIGGEYVETLVLDNQETEREDTIGNYTETEKVTTSMDTRTAGQSTWDSDRVEATDDGVIRTALHATEHTVRVGNEVTVHDHTTAETTVVNGTLIHTLLIANQFHRIIEYHEESGDPATFFASTGTDQLFFSWVYGANDALNHYQIGLSTYPISNGNDLKFVVLGLQSIEEALYGVESVFYPPIEVDVLVG